MDLVPTGSERRRVERAIRAAIGDFALDLRGIGVLTEAASGSFSVTCIAAALAGGIVTAVTRDSRYGRAADICEGIAAWAVELGVSDRLQLQIGRPVLEPGSVDLVTNLGFVRPIDRQVLSRLSPYAAVALMWEPWEFRHDDIDFRAAKELSIPVIATNETDPRIRTFEYLGLLAAKLLLESQCAILGAHIAVIGSDPFGKAIRESLSGMGANVRGYDPLQAKTSVRDWYASLDPLPDFLVVAEHRARDLLIGGDGIPVDLLRKHGTGIVHICGSVDALAIHAADIRLHPSEPAPHGRMSVTTAYVGAAPVIGLHLGSLRAAEIVVRARRAGANPDEAVAKAVKSGLGLAMPLEAFDPVAAGEPA